MVFREWSGAEFPKQSDEKWFREFRRRIPETTQTLRKFIDNYLVMMKRVTSFMLLMSLLLIDVLTGCSSKQYEEVASFTDKGRNRAYFIALKGELSSEDQKNTLQEIVDKYMEEYGIAPQMWIFFFDDKKYTPKEFPIEGEALEHLVAKFFWATDTRRKDLKIFTEEEKEALKKEGTIESPLWEGQ